MNISKCLSRDYQSPTTDAIELGASAVLCQSDTGSNDYDSTMEGVGREEFIW